jgi:hypothetical protein
MTKIVTILLITASLAFGQSAGNAGMSFLKIGFGARQLALGDFGIAGINDVTAYNYNPALLSKFENSQIIFTHNQWIQDLSSNMLGATFEMFSLPFAFTVNSTSIKDIEVRTRPGDVESTFNANYMYIGLSTGFKVYDNLSTGLTFRYVYENLFSDESSGMLFDLGLYYADLIEHLDLAFSLRNLGSVDVLRNEETEVPTDLRLGASYKMSAENINTDFTFIAGYQKYTPLDDSHIHLGAEAFYDEVVAVRLGYMTGYESKGLTTGLGLKWKGINFDYAYTPFDYNLGNSHTISLMYTFH